MLNPSPASHQPSPADTYYLVPSADGVTAGSPLVKESAGSASAACDLVERVACDPQAARRPAMQGLPPRPDNTRYHLLDPLRGLACLMLMIYHASFYAEYSWVSSDPSTWSLGGLGINLISRLWIGVPIFFVISGYCIAASLDSLRRKPHCLREFYYRRMRRIYPPLWAGLMLGVAVTLLVSCHAPTYERCLQLPRLASFTTTDWVANATGTATWLPKLSGEDGQHLLLNVWTLAYEEQFYAVAGLLLLLAPRRIFLASYLIAGLSIVLRHVCRLYGVPIQGFFFDGHWVIFACGILLYQQLHYLELKDRRTAAAMLGLGCAYGLAERFLASSAWDRHVGEYIVVACVCTIALRHLKRLDHSATLNYLLAPLRTIGKFSFSLYLTHFPITVLTASLLAAAGVTRDSQVLLITIPVCLLLSFPVGWLFYQKVERHFLNTAPSG